MGQIIKKPLQKKQLSPLNLSCGAGLISKNPRIKTTKGFQLQTKYSPAGDQPQAIKHICQNLKEGQNYNTLLGVTGSGKTFTVANIIQEMQKPSLILAPNKTLAGQLFGEFKELFPKNAVEYFVSYYDYYQPEAYLPTTDTYIEKDASINDQIDRMRHSATIALLSRQDVIIVSSVSCIYGLGSPETYRNLMLPIHLNQAIKRDSFLKSLVDLQYERQDFDFHRGTFRVRGDRVELFPSYSDDIAFRFEFFGDYIDFIGRVDPLTGEVLEELEKLSIYPASHYVSTEKDNQQAIKTIKEELKSRLKILRNQKRKLEHDRLKKRTLYDIEMIQEMGTCPGIENYSRHFTGRKAGEPPPTLLEYFPKEWLLFVDESHISVPQVGGMYRGDRSRKEVLVQHGFRLPSALDNRPLNFQEFENSIHQVVYVSATPGDYEIQKSQGEIIEQIIRPTGLLDPKVFIRPTIKQVEDLGQEIKKREKKQERVLVVTLTKKMAESLTAHYQSEGFLVKYLHSDIKTIERMELIRDLRLGVFQVLIGINLLREGLDLPEVSLVAVMDADKEGFLRSKRSLIQIIGRSARHINGQVILYADEKTDSIKYAVQETKRRRKIQSAFNKKHNIKIQSIKKSAPKGLMELYGYKDPLNTLHKQVKTKKIKEGEDKTWIRKEITFLKKEMKKAGEELNFERAMELRDKIKRLEIQELNY